MNCSETLLEPDDSYDGILVRIVEEAAYRKRTGPDRLPALANVIEPNSSGDPVPSADDTATVVFSYDSYGVLVESGGGLSISRDNG